MLSPERKNRYLDKIGLAEERATYVEEWHKNKEDVKSRLATYKAFQELAEAVLDICSMICKDEGKNVRDDYANIETIKSLKIIDEKTARALAEMNGLRNRIVHEYNGIRYDIFSESAERLIGDTGKFAESVKAWSEKKSWK